jgi:hypothetical protein
LKEVFFKPRVGAIENVYVGSRADLVMFREASLPDVCIVCGTRAWGNIHRAQFQPYRHPSLHIPIIYDIAYWIVGARYTVDFPFCSICTPESFDINTTRIDEKVGFFTGVSNTFMKLLPRIPLELAAELEGTWAQRALRSFMH